MVVIIKMYDYRTSFPNSSLNRQMYSNKYNNNANKYTNHSQIHTPPHFNNFINNSNSYTTNNNKFHTSNYNENISKVNISTNENNNKKCTENNITSTEQNNCLFEIFGFKIYFDDVLILCILLFLYKEGIQDEYLFIALILLLLS